MEWYYTVNGQQTGPIPETELDRLAVSGAVAPETLVWHVGMGDWRPYREARSSAASPSIPPGVPLTADAPHYGGFWVRFVALFIDGLILGTVGVILNLLFLRGSQLPSDMPTTFGPDYFTRLGLASLVNLAIGMCYHAFFLSKYSATPGKMVFGLRVITEDGGPISLPRAVGRYFCYLLDSVTFFIGYIIAAFDVQKRALHDYICRTRVIYVK